VSGEIGRFSAIIGGDASGLSRTLAGSARTIEGFVKDTQQSFAKIGVGGDFAKAGARAGAEIVAALKAQLDAGRPLLKQFAENVDVGNAAAVRVVKELVAEHQKLSAAAGASAAEMQEIANIQHTLKGRELGEAAARARALEENAKAAAQQLRGIALAIKEAGRSTSGLDAISRRISQFSEGTGFASTRTQSLERLRTIEVSLQRALQSTAPTLTQRIQLERELARTSEAIRAAQSGSVDALGRTGASARGAIGPVNALTSSLLRQVVAYASVREAIRVLQGSFGAADDQERAARKLNATARLTGTSFDQIKGFAKDARSEFALSAGQTSELASQMVKLASRAGQAARTGEFLTRWMDLAAANGLTLDETLQSIQSTLIGQDEGLNRLGLANPSQIYERWAKAAKTTVSAMSDSQKAQAVLSAVVEAGGKVQGEYARSLSTSSGQQQKFKAALDETAASFGRSLSSQRAFVTEGATGFLHLIRVLNDMDDTLDGLRPKFRLLGAFLTGNAGEMAAAILQAEREITGATDKAAKERAAAARKIFQGPPAPRSAIKITADDDTKALEAEVKTLRTLHDAQALRGIDVARARELERQLTATINSGLSSRERLAELTSIRADVRSVLDTSKAVSELIDKIETLATAYGLARNNAGLQQEIIPQLVAGYDRVGKLLAAQTNQASATSNELREQLAVLKSFDPVLVGLARRQFGPADQLPTVTVPVIGDLKDIRQNTDPARRLVVSLLGNIVDIQIPKSVKDLAAKSLVFKNLPPITPDVDPTFDVTKFSLGFKNALESARFAKADLSLTDAIKDQDAFAKATKRSAEAQKQLRVIAADLANVIRNNPALSSAQKTSGLEQLDAQVRAATTDTKTLGDRLRGVASFTRGIASAADAVGLIGDRARLAIANVSDLADGVARLADALKSGSQGDFFAAVAQSAAAATNIIKSLFGDKGAEDKRNQDIRRENTQAIIRLSQDLAGFGQTARQQLNAANAIRTNPLVASRLADGTTRGFKNIEELDRQLKAGGTSIAELKRRAEELGITLTDSTGRITAQGLHDLDIALRFAAEKLVRFTNTVADQSDAAALRRRVLGQQNDQAKIIDDGLGILKQFAPKLFGAFFAGVDTSTKEGRDRFRAQLRAFVEKFTANLIATGDFGELDKSTLIQFVNSWLDGLDSMTDAMKTAAGEMINVAQGFAVQRRVFQVQSQSNFRDLIPPKPSPTPIPIPTGGDGGASVSISVDVGGLTISPTVPATGAARYNEIRRQALDKARTISPAAVEAVQQALPPL
jgi:hypothetical protein